MNNTIFRLSIIFGIGIAVYIYGFFFDQLSEEQLVGLSPLWLLPIIFGAYGFIAESLLALIEKGEAKTIGAAAFIFLRTLPIVGIILMLPFLVVRGDSAITIAFLSALFWGVLLILFFQLLFPLL